MSRILTFFLMVLLVSTLAWAKVKKDKNDPASLMAKSDALYYYPSLHGITDLAVDLVIPQFAASDDTKEIKITYYYAGENRQQFAVGNIPAQHETLRPDVLALISPYSQNLIPSTSEALFKGLTLKTEEVDCQFLGSPETVYYQIVGTTPDKNAEIKEQHVLYDKQGVIHQLEFIAQNGTPSTVGIENVRIGDKWQISKMTFREITETDTFWRTVTIEYAMVDGFSLPTHISVTHRGILNQSVSGAGMDLDIQFKNYRINQGIAAAFLPSAGEVSKTGTSAPSTSTVQLAPPARPGSSPSDVQW